MAGSISTKPRAIQWPLDQRGVEAIDRNFDDIFRRVVAVQTGENPLLDATAFSDVISSTVTRGDIITGQVDSSDGTIKWDDLAIGAAGKLLRSDGTDLLYSTFTIPGTFAQGDVLYASSANVLAGLTKSASATRYIANTGTSNNPAWAQVDLSNGVTGTLPIENGGTEATSFTAYAVICGGTTTTTALQPIAGVGSSGQVLTSNGAAALPTFQNSVVGAHALLSTQHSDTLASAVSRGSLIYGNATPAWAELVVGSSGAFLRNDGTDVAWSTLILPNAATSTRVVYASATNTYGESANLTFDGTRLTANNLTVSGGIIFLNDSANTKMTNGLTVNQAAADDEVFAAKSSDITHGMTDIAEADTFLTFSKNDATGGGGQINGYSSTTGGFGFNARHTIDNTVKDATAGAAIVFTAQLRSGTTVTSLGANANIAVFRNSGDVRWIVDGEGDVYRDGTDNTYDDFEDIELAAAWENAMRPDLPVRTSRYTFEDLQGARLLGDTPKNGRKWFYNESALLRLMVGTHRQTHARVLDRKAESEALAEVVWTELQRLPPDRKDKLTFLADWKNITHAKRNA